MGVRGIGHRLNRRLDHYRRESTADGSGGTITTWTYQDTVRCRTSQPSASERVIAEQAGAAHTTTIYLSTRSPVRRGDELRDDTSGERWRVMSTFSPSRPIYLRADCQLIESEPST